MIEDEVLYFVDVIDIAATARKVLGGHEAFEKFCERIPDHDYRFHITFTDGVEVTFGQLDTAAHVAEWLKREGKIGAKDTEG